MLCRMMGISQPAVSGIGLGADTASPVSWAILIAGEMDGLKDSSATLGVRPDATADFDVSYDRPCPPNPPGDWLQVFFPHTGGTWPTLLGTRFSADFTEPVSPSWLLNVESTLGPGPARLYWDSAAVAALPKGYEILMRDSASGDTIRLRHRSSYLFQYSSLRVFTIWIAYDASFLAITPGWNLISVPRLEADSTKRRLFPTAISSAFGYDGSYVVSDILARGRGYWLKFEAGETMAFNGTTVLIDTVELREGWNMIGSLSVAIPVGSIASIPPGVATSRFFDYQGTYRQADSIVPGHGYWVRVYQKCSLVLSPAAGASRAGRPQIGVIEGLPPGPPGELSADPASPLPRDLILFQNYPNPFNPSTMIRYALPEAADVRLVLGDVLGREVAILRDGTEQPGMHELSLDADRLRLPGGTYFYRLIATGQLSGRTYVDAKKFILVR